MTVSEQSAALLPTLSGAYYTSAAVFAAEQQQLFERMWICVVRAGDLPDPGQFKTVQVGRESVLVVRGRDRILRAFLNVCRHRGARLCIKPEGHVRHNLCCPYHSWTYSLDGTLLTAPNIGSLVGADGAGIDRYRYGLISVSLREWLGYAWVCLNEDPPSFKGEVIGAATHRLGDPGAIDNYQIDTLQVGHRVAYDVAANWKLIVENFMECYHCATIHPELTRLVPEFARGQAAQCSVGRGAEFGAAVAGFTVDGSAGFATLPGISPHQHRRYFAITVKPTVFINLVPDHVIFHRMFPMAPDRTIVECDWLYAADVAPGSDLSHSVEVFHRVNAQDFAACERTQPAMSSRAYRAGGVLVPTEHHITEFHRWVVSRVGMPSEAK
jgi:glycine betaine catabolism A